MEMILYWNMYIRLYERIYRLVLYVFGYKGVYEEMLD